MAEKQEGLDLDDLEVPTAAKVTDVGIMPSEGAAIQNFVQITEGEKFVKERKHEEALQEAVQHGREQERRRILNKIEKAFSDIDKALQDYQQSSDRDIPYMVKTVLDNHKEELEEEVSEE